VLESDIGSEEKLKMLMKVSAEGFLGNGGEFAGIMMEFWSEGIRNKDEKMIEIINMQKMYSEYRGMIAQILEEGMSRGIFRKIDTFMTASVLIGAMDGILLQWIMDPKIFTPQNAVEVLVDSYVNGIKK
jgi:hypothetical protein